jgi:hypothetical protein
MAYKSKISGQQIFQIFLILWTVLNLVQAFFTPIHNDEAYYWMYSRYPAWGYYDHPPMIALFIKAGYAIFHNTLGVRLFIIISQVITLLIIWRLIDKDRRDDKTAAWIFVLVLAVLPIINITGFIATPDSPLVLFTALFLMSYKKFVDRESWSDTFLMGVTMAGIMYSKYHGAIMLLLIIVSNPKLLKNLKFYIASLSALVLYIPHLAWQFSNDFPSIRYHLSQRAAGFELANIPEYIINQVLIHNPFILPLFLWIIFRSGVKNTFEKGLKYIISGFFIFFLIASVRYRIQPQWTALITVPMLILFLNKTEFKSGIAKYFKWASIIMLPFFLFARCTLMADFLPVSFLKDEFHNPGMRMKEIEKLAGSRPVVFTNSYQDPSVYTFYTGKTAHTLDNKDYRKTQFDLWPFEEQLNSNEVLYMPHWLNDYYKSKLSFHVTEKGDTLYYRIFKDFQSLQKECVLTGRAPFTFCTSSDNIIDLKIFNPYNHTIKLDHPEFPVVFQAAFYKPDGYLEEKKNLILPEEIKTILPGDTINVSCKFRIDKLPEGEYNFVILSETGILYDTFSSRFSKAYVRK